MTDQITIASREVLAGRSEICLEHQIGLTKLYNEVDAGAYRDRHDAVRDSAVINSEGGSGQAEKRPAQ
jgi:hypothetical protein